MPTSGAGKAKMKNLFSIKNTWDLIAVLVALLAFAAALYQFTIGRHYIIPTAILVWTVLFGNLASYGLKGERWAKHILFWFGFLVSCMGFMGIFFAQRPKEILGGFFLPVWIAGFLLVAWLTWQYRRSNRLSG